MKNIKDCILFVEKLDNKDLFVLMQVIENTRLKNDIKLNIEYDKYKRELLLSLPKNNNNEVV